MSKYKIYQQGNRYFTIPTNKRLKEHVMMLKQLKSELPGDFREYDKLNLSNTPKGELMKKIIDLCSDIASLLYYQEP